MFFSDISDCYFEVQTFQNMPIDDTPGEGPHAEVSAIMKCRGRKTWPWVASTARLTETLADARWMPGALGVDVEQLWARHGNLVSRARAGRGAGAEQGRTLSQLHHQRLVETGAVCENDVSVRPVEHRRVAQDK